MNVPARTIHGREVAVFCENELEPLTGIALGEFHGQFVAGAVVIGEERVDHARGVGWRYAVAAIQQVRFLHQLVGPQPVGVRDGVKGHEHLMCSFLCPRALAASHECPEAVETLAHVVEFHKSGAVLLRVIVGVQMVGVVERDAQVTLEYRQAVFRKGNAGIPFGEHAGQEAAPHERGEFLC